MDVAELAAPFERMLEELCPPPAVRAVEAGDTGAAQAMWAGFAASGFLDALVPEERSGAGLALADIAPLLIALGRHAVPLPVGQTMLARAWLDAPPEGPIALATSEAGIFGAEPFRLVANHVLVVDSGGLTIEGALSGAQLPPPGAGPHLAGLIAAAAIAGAGERVLALAIDHANTRVQFGKPVGRQQAVQHMLAVMAEQVVAVRLMVEQACAVPNLASCAAAKAVASAAAADMAEAAHAVIGAIGISAEHDLQLYTRRLHAMRLAHGSESHWQRVLGALRLASDAPCVDWLRAEIFAEAGAL